MTHSFSVRFCRLDDREDSLCPCNLWGKEQLAVKLPADFSVKNHRASWYSWFFRQRLAFDLLREFLYCNETLEQRPRVTFAAHRFRHRKHTQTQKAKHSITGIFLFLSWPKHRRRETFFVSLRRDLRSCTRFTFVGLNRTRSFHFFSTAWVRCITTLGRACWR